MNVRAPTHGAVDAETATPRALTILAVDDDALVLMNTSAMIEDLGHTPLEALSGSAALAALREQATIDLVITDQSMPEMSGLALAQAVQSEWPGVPVIVATGYTELPPGSPPIAKLNKPFTQEDLAIAIEGAVRSGGSARS